jgi:tripartite-type tricarboxylate transporter receptor subunit TctC
MKRWVFLLAAAFCCAAGAQGYPAKSVRFIVSFPPGGSADLMVRAIAPHMGNALGQTVIVENRAGAGGMVGVDAVAKAAPDGYTIGLAAAGALSSNISLYPKMPYHPQKDLAPISMLAMIPFFLVAHPSQASSLQDLIQKAKANPGALSYGHGGQGSTMHLAGELFNMMANVKVQSVPYKGSGPVSVDVLGGQVPLGVVDVPSSIANVRAGKLRALAVTTKRRIVAAPEVPTFEEAGIPGYEAIGWFGAVAPAGTPPDVIQKLNSEITKALSSPDVKEKALSAGAEPFPTSPQEFADVIRDETRKWAEVIKAAGIKLQ